LCRLQLLWAASFFRVLKQAGATLDALGTDIKFK